MDTVGGPIIDATARLIAWPDSVLNSINYVTTAVIFMAAVSGIRAVTGIIQLFKGK